MGWSFSRIQKQEVEAVKVHNIDHVGIVVNDLAAAQAFFLDCGLQLQGEGKSGRRVGGERGRAS